MEIQKHCTNCGYESRSKADNCPGCGAPMAPGALQRSDVGRSAWIEKLETSWARRLAHYERNHPDRGFAEIEGRTHELRQCLREFRAEAGSFSIVMLNHGEEKA